MKRLMEALVPAAVAAVVSVAAAQEEPPIAAAAACQEDIPVVGSLGYSALSCNCTHYLDTHDPENSRWEFRSEPMIRGVRPDGPADGKLLPGDAIVAIDGHLITTREGGRRFARLRAGGPIRLRVRRAGEEIDVTIVPDAECAVAPPAPGAVPGERVVVRPDRIVFPVDPIVVLPSPATLPRPAPLPTVLRSAPPLPPPPPALRRGWLGFSLSCSDCVVLRPERGDPVWRFSSSPLVEGVERASPAFRAGIRAGDRLTTIDGIDLTTVEGGERFGATRPGRPVTFGYLRDGGARVVSFVVGERPVPKPARPVPTPWLAATPERAVTRFTGVLGEYLIHVSGAPVTVSQTETEVIIRSRDLTVRIAKSEDSQGRR